MKRFVLLLLGLAALTLFCQCGAYVMAFVVKQPRINSHYTLKEHQKYLFLGSSHLGCGIEESPEFENKVMWTAATPIQVSLLQLKELERRRQLGHVKAVCLSMNSHDLAFAAKEKALLQAYYRHLPVSLRYVDVPSVGWWRLIWSCLSSTHFPFAGISPNEVPPSPRLPLTKQWPQKRVDSLRRNIPESARNWEVKTDMFAKLEEIELSSLREFKEICDRNHLLLVVIQMPELPGYVENLTPEALAFFRNLQSKVAAMGIDVWIPKGNYGLDAFVEELHQTEESAHRLTAEIHAYLSDL